MKGLKNKIRFGPVFLDQIPKEQHGLLYSYCKNIERYGLGFEAIIYDRKLLFEKYIQPTKTIGKRQYWYNHEGLLHSRYDMPAEIKFNGTMVWHNNGFEHRDNNMPSFIGTTGTIIWRVDGVQKRDYNWKPSMTTLSMVYFWHGAFEYKFPRKTYINNIFEFVKLIEK